MQVEVSINAVVERLGGLYTRLVDENRHDDALIIDLAMQALSSMPSQSPGEDEAAAIKEIVDDAAMAATMEIRRAFPEWDGETFTDRELLIIGVLSQQMGLVVGAVIRRALD